MTNMNYNDDNANENVSLPEEEDDDNLTSVNNEDSLEDEDFEDEDSDEEDDAELAEEGEEEWWAMYMKTACYVIACRFYEDWIFPMYYGG